jgi:glycosyltransferase involved in cell wall biosynthesis
MMLADIWAKVSTRHPNARLALVGTGEGSVDSCEAELRARLDGTHLRAVLLPGAVGNVHEWLQAADVFAFPSDSEGFGLSILEAMAVGVPMVCTRVGVAAELPSSPMSALLVAPRDQQAFGEALGRLLEDANLRQTLAGRARELVRGRFSMEAVAQRYAELAAQLVASRHDPVSAH